MILIKSVEKTLGMKKFNKYHFLHKLHFHELPFQFFNKYLKVLRFSDDLTWYGKSFQILGPHTLSLF